MKKLARTLTVIFVLLSVLCLASCKKEDSGGGSNPPVEGNTNPQEHVCSMQIVAEQHQTCDSDGVVKYACECGKTNLEITKATGHSFGKLESVSASTCKEYGENVRRCEICSYEERSYLPLTSHNYTVNEVETGGILMAQYLCEGCGDSFDLPVDLSNDLANYEDKRLVDCQVDFTFMLFCPYGEDYIRENLKIIDTYYEGVENSGFVSYELIDYGEGVWLVSPTENYEEGSTYKAIRSGSIIFADTGIYDLTFSIHKEQSDIAEVDEGVIFLAALERSNPGYYPYAIDYSDASATYWVTLGKVDGLKVGDIICIGECHNADGLMVSDSENVFGKIEFISYSDEKNAYILALSAPELSDVFSELDIYSDKFTETDAIKFTDSEELTAQVTAALCNSKDFIDFMGASYVTATELLASRGANANIGTFEEFLNSIEFDEEKSQKPEIDPETGVITAKIFINGKVSIPITVNSYGSDRNVGNIVISFTAYVYLDYIKLQVHITETEDLSGNAATKFRFGVAESVTIGFTFDVAIDVDYSLEAKAYVLNKRSGAYHFAKCIHVASMNEENAEYIDAMELLERINKGEIDEDKECGICRPVSAMNADNYVLNVASKKIHLVECKHLQNTNESDLVISGAAYGNLELSGYVPCESCKPYSKYTNSFSEALMNKMENGDFGHNIAEIKAASDKAETRPEKNKLLIAEMPLGFSAIRADLEIYVYVNFTLDASLSYKFERTDQTEFGVELKGKKLSPYVWKDSTTNEHSLEVMGKTRLEVGAIGVAKFYVIGMEKWMYFSFNAECGAYALANGALRIDVVSMNDSYMAAYFEAGFLLDMYVEVKLPLIKTFNHTFYSGEYPLFTLGYEKVVHKFTSLPDCITLEDTYYRLNVPELTKVGYFDLITMEPGEAHIFPGGIEGRYTVEYSFEEGENCFVENGILYVIDPSRSFTDVLYITIIGEDKFGEYKDGKVKFSVPTVEVPIEFEAQDDVLSYDIGPGKEFYIVIGIGTHHPGALEIPETYNDKPVKEIERHAFSGCSIITSVVIPDGIVDIGDHVFYCCPNITSVTIGNGLEYVSQGAFNGCESVSHISIGENVKVIADSAFGGCNYVSWVVIPDSVVEIHGGAFGDCRSLRTVIVGKSVETIGRHAFSGCFDLADIYLPRTLIGMGDNVFYYCDKLSNIYYEGSESDMMKISTDESNIEYVQKATVHFNYNY